MYVQITLLAFLAKMFWLDCDRNMRCVVSYDTLLYLDTGTMDVLLFASMVQWHQSPLLTSETVITDVIVDQKTIYCRSYHN